MREKALSDFLYAVACGFRGKTSVIHCDRMRKCKSQILTGEENDRSDEENAPEYENGSLSDGDEHLSANDVASASVDLRSRPQCKKRLPAWHDDFVVEYKI